MRDDQHSPTPSTPVTGCPGNSQAGVCGIASDRMGAEVSSLLLALARTKVTAALCQFPMPVKQGELCLASSQKPAVGKCW